MKKIFVTLSLLLAFVLGGNTANAQETFEQGTNMINVGVGFGKMKNQAFPPMSVAYEHSLVSNLFDYGSIGLGGQLDTHLFDYNEGTGYKSFIGPRLSWHYEWADHLDTYVSGAAGLLMERKLVSKIDENGRVFNELASENSFRPVFTVGARYLFTKHFGAFTEISTSISYFKVGLSLNL